MQTALALARLVKIKWTVGKYGLRWRRARRGKLLRQLLAELGPIYIKFGQLLATRRDSIPLDIAQELALLLDQVTPFPSEQAQAIVEQSFNKPLSALFASFEMTPLASASIAQVHGAILHDGSKVVVKILRPNISRLIRRDIRVLRLLANIIHRLGRGARRLRLPELVEELATTLTHELDLLREAANAAQLKRNFSGSSDLYVPTVYWQFCRQNILVTERIGGIRIDRVAELRALNVNMERLARNGVLIFYTQVFKHSFFHADMHPGNIFVDVTDPEFPQYMAVDFGIMGSLSVQDRRYIAENLLAFLNRDYIKIAQLHIDTGWVAKTTPVQEFAASIRSVCEPIFAKPLREISLAQILIQLFRTGAQFDMQVQPQLLLLQKTLLSVEGLGKQLYPELDLWQTAQPFLEQWWWEEYGPPAVFKQFLRKIPYWIERWLA